MNTNFINFTKTLISFILVIAFGYILSSLLYLWLPKESIEFKKEQNINLDYRKFNIKTAFYEKKVVVKEKPVIKVKKPEYQPLKNIKLKAIYSMGEQKGWIILEDGNRKTHMLSVNESFKGYKLVRVYANYVIFAKQAKEYKLELSDSDKVSFSVTQKIVQPTNKTKQKVDPRDDANVVVLDDKVSVQRAYLNSYINNFDKIWKEISIRETKDSNGKINGFKVNGFSKKSVFKKLGLKKGDIIKAVNNIELKSYDDAFHVYKKVNKLKDLNIRILRGGREMELDYEIE